MRLRLFATMAVVAFVLAGCSGKKADDGDGTDPASSGGGSLPMLHGYVFDPAVRPLEGVTVKVLDTNSTTVTDEEGFFGFTELPVEQFLVVVASIDGFSSGSKQVTLTPTAPVRLNFTLDPIPVQTPRMTTAKGELLVECQVGVTAQGQNSSYPCGSGTQDVDTWDIPIEPDLSGAVIEIYWDPGTTAASSIGARLETLELGQLNLVLAEVVGTSPLRLSVPQLAAERYYTAGGLMRLTVYAAPNADENEAGVGASALVEQAITAYASLFYVAPPDPAYTIANAGQ
ncbi:MAG TPA: carboxypeptidase-like regulatory domain-containing protein [Candidatus Thermoplasmatota archaeon]|nr:carboxypeptidase-like regulatory domain-containing protein [Candidatus Thermoplasmatota archaeon]